MPRIRWGLCCQFLDAPIRFRQATHRHVSRLGVDERRAYLSGVVRDNAEALHDAVRECARLGIGAFRVGSQFAPLATHPESGYRLRDLDDGDAIVARLREARALATSLDVRLSFHPDQFVVLNSAHEHVVDSSVRELDAMASLAELIGADTLTVHGGGAAGGRDEALLRLERALDRLSDAARARVALENDDRTWAPAALLPLCERTGVPFVYDVHHHRCLPDGLSVREATERGAATWGGREPWFHVSSPREGWTARDPRPHHDYAIAADVPASWRGMTVTVDVEAKAKERAVTTLARAVRRARVAELLDPDGRWERAAAPPKEPARRGGTE